MRDDKMTVQNNDEIVNGVLNPVLDLGSPGEDMKMQDARQTGHAIFQAIMDEFVKKQFHMGQVMVALETATSQTMLALAANYAIIPEIRSVMKPKDIAHTTDMYVAAMTAKLCAGIVKYSYDFHMEEINGAREADEETPEETQIV